MSVARALILPIVLALLTPWACAGPLAAGDETGAWVVARGARSGAVLLFLPPDATDPLAHAAASLPSPPIAMACEDRAVFLLFPRRPSSTPGVQLLPARRIARTSGSRTRPEFSRPEILAPLREGGEVVGVALIADVPLVLRRSVEPSGPTLTLVNLRANRWSPIDLPATLDPTAPTWLVAIAHKPALAQQAAPRTLRLWTLTSFDRGDASPGEWAEQPVPTPRPIDALLTFPSGPRAVVHPSASTLDLLALHEGSFTPAWSIDLERADQAEVPWGAGLALFWDAPGTDSGLLVRLISADAKPIADGALEVAGPVSPAELQILIVVLSSVFLTAIVFMLRPELRVAGALQFPPNASLASPARRAVAYLIDLIPGLGVAYLLWFADARSLADATSMLAERGAAPILAIAAITIVHATIGEATTGRTLGKALARCRTISYTGRRPLWRQALARNAVKVLCPPVGLFLLLAPASPHPGSFDTLVIVDHPPTRPPEAGSPPPSPPRDPSDPS